MGWRFGELVRVWESNTISGRARLEVVSALVVAPLVEEVVFRMLPFWLAGRLGWGHPRVGFASAAMFGLMHVRFGRWFVAYAGAGGLVLWAAYARTGLSGAVLLHLAANMADLSLGWRRYLYAALSPGSRSARGRR